MNGLWIMIEREFMARIAKKGYWFMTLFGLVLMVGLTFVPALVQFIDQATKTKIAIADPNHLVSPAVALLANTDKSSYTLRFVPSQQARGLSESPALVKGYFKTADTPLLVVVKGANPANASFVFEENGSIDLDTLQQVENLLRQEVMSARIRQLAPGAQAEMTRPVSFVVHQWKAHAKTTKQMVQSELLVYVMIILLFMTVLTYGAWVVQGVIEEKSNRIVEMMLISVKPWQILFGKVLGLALVALLQYAVWTTGVGTAMVLQKSLTTLPIHEVPPMTLAMFPVFFLLGYLMYATLFSIGGSLVHRSEEQQLAVTPVTLLLVAVFYIGLFALFQPDSPFAVIVSFIPFCTPIVMFARMALTDVPLWQVAVSIIGSVAVIWLFIWAGATVYRRFALHTSGQSGWKLLFQKRTAG